jgi:hypothetical protein
MKTTPRKISIAIAATVSCAALLSACGGGSGASVATVTPPEQTMGTLRVALTDAPACGYDAVNVTVTKVRVNQSASAGDNDAGWTDITLNPARKINLLALSNGALDTLGQASLAAGHYSQLRLLLAANSTAEPVANSVVPTGGFETALDTPSAAQSGIKLVNEFDVAAGTLVDLTLDFDACRSIVRRGNSGVLLKPVISVIPMVVSGAIVGVVDPALALSKPVVSAQQNGVIVKSTVPDASGAFSLSPIVAGNYTVVLTADGHASDVIGAVPVTAKANTVLSTATAPLGLPASPVGTISGSVLPATAEASVRAIEFVGSGTQVTMRYQAADLATGAYSLTLPTAAPVYSQFSTLPIVFLPQLSAAGQYSVEASATGYQAQAASIDISLANAVKNFTLAP